MVNAPNLARLQQSEENYPEAETLYIRILKTRDRLLGKTDTLSSSSRKDLAGLYRDKGDDEPAERLYRESLEIQEKRLGPEHRDTLATLGSLAFLYDKKKDYAAADPLYIRAGLDPSSAKPLFVQRLRLGSNFLQRSPTSAPAHQYRSRSISRTTPNFPGASSKLFCHLIEFLVDALPPCRGEIELKKLIECLDRFDPFPCR